MRTSPCWRSTTSSSRRTRCAGPISSSRGAARRMFAAVMAVMEGRVPNGIVNRDVVDRPGWKARLADYAQEFGGRLIGDAAGSGKPGPLTARSETSVVVPRRSGHRRDREARWTLQARPWQVARHQPCGCSRGGDGNPGERGAEDAQRPSTTPCSPRWNRPTGSDLKRSQSSHRASLHNRLHADAVLAVEVRQRPPTGRTGRRRAARPDAPRTEPSQPRVAGCPSTTVTMRASRASGASSVSTWESTPVLPAIPALRARCAAPHPRQSRSAEGDGEEGRRRESTRPPRHAPPSPAARAHRCRRWASGAPSAGRRIQ